MTRKPKQSANELTSTEFAEMEELFRTVDFASENPGLEGRLRQKIADRLVRFDSTDQKPGNTGSSISPMFSQDGIMNFMKNAAADNKADGHGAALTPEFLQDITDCETPEELMSLAKSRGVGITREQADAYLAERDDMPLDEEALRKVAGGFFHSNNIDPACKDKT